jgi:glucokinase
VSTADRAIGVDVGGTKILAGVLDRDGRIVRSHETRTPLGSQAALLEALESSVAELVEPDVAAVGFGIPSTIDQRTGRAVSSVNIPFADVDLRSFMHERFGLPVGVDNDANAAAFGEWAHGAGRGTRHMVMLTLGTGVGGGLILDGRPYRGAIGAGAELGHMVVALDGPPCQGSCTGRGHLEALASGHAASEAARKAFGPDVDSHGLVRLAGEGDARAIELLATIGHALGGGIATLVNVFNPEVVVVGGGFAAAGDFILGPARETLAREALEPGRSFVRIVRAQLGSEAGLVGAGLVAFEALEAAGVPI